MEKYDKVKKELEEALNRNSIDNLLNTPDFILADYLVRCLEAYRFTNLANTQWHGYDTRFNKLENPEEDKTIVIRELKRQIEELKGQISRIGEGER